jgi:hypothetical protein
MQPLKCPRLKSGVLSAAQNEDPNPLRHVQTRNQITIQASAHHLRSGINFLPRPKKWRGTAPHASGSGIVKETPPRKLQFESLKGIPIRLRKSGGGRDRNRHNLRREKAARQRTGNRIMAPVQAREGLH